MLLVLHVVAKEIQTIFSEVRKPDSESGLPAKPIEVGQCGTKKNRLSFSLN